MNQPKLPPELQKLVELKHNDPFAVLGRHSNGNGLLVRVFLPHADEVTIAEGGYKMQRIEGTDIFEWQDASAQVPERYRLIWRDDQHREHIAHDPYCYPPQLSDFDLHLFGEGKHDPALLWR